MAYPIILTGAFAILDGIGNYIAQGDTRAEAWDNAHHALDRMNPVVLVTGLHSINIAKEA